MNRCVDFKIVKEKTGKTKLKKLIDEIRKYRNDIAHGRKVPNKHLKENLEKGIYNFQTVVSLFES